MKEKIIVFAISIIMLISLMLVAFGGGLTNGAEISEKEIDKEEEPIEKREQEMIDGQDSETRIDQNLGEDKHEGRFIDRRWEGPKKGLRHREETENGQLYPLDDSSYDKSTARGDGVSLSRRRSSGENIDSNSLDLSGVENNYQEHDPIRIDDNSDFSEKAENKNWSGNGTADDPYIIEGYEIDGQGHGYSLYIGNVTDHFELNGCFLHNASEGKGGYFSNRGLHLFNTSNGSIEDNIVENNSRSGIYLEQTDNITISNNIIYSNQGHEIQIEESHGNEVIDNEIHGESFSQETSSTQQDIEFRQDSILVKLESTEKDMVSRWGEETALKLKTDEVADTLGGRTSRTFPAFDMAEIKLNDGVEVRNAVEASTRISDVIHAEPNYIVEPTAVPNDPGYDSLWAMPTIDAPEAWDITVGSEEVVVAVIDTGIDYNHPDLKDNMWTSEEGNHGYNVINDTHDPMDEHGHGTHVAGTIGAVGDNDLGVVGVNWNVSLMGVKFIGEDGGGAIGDAIAGLEYVLERKRDGENIVATSNSWGGTGYSELLYEAIEQHQKEGISFVAAAGNARADNDQDPFYPAGYDLNNIISVAATNEDDDLAVFSNYGKRTVHVGAPGVDINSTILDGEYGYLSGTSMAAPHVSGLMALLASHNPSYDHNQLKNAILSSADHLDSLKNITMMDGRINAHQALEITPDPDDIRFWTHRPTSKVPWGEENPISISLNDGVDPILEANVTVDFSTGEDTVYLEDDGSGGDQPGDGYYTGEWIPRYLGEANLTITARLDDNREITKNVTVEVRGDAGITLFESEENILKGNNVTDNYRGISLYSSDLNEINNNQVTSNNQAGIRLLESKNNTLSNLTVSDSEFGMLFETGDGNLLYNNTVSDTFMGIMLQRDSKENRLINNTAFNNFYGFIIEKSRENKVIDNEIHGNRFYGIILYLSDNNTLENNNIYDNWMYDMYILESNDNMITSNNVSETDMGISLLESKRNKLENNTLSNNLIGIYLVMSENTILMENTMNEVGIYLQGPSLEHWNTHEIGTSNIIDGSPVYYLKNEVEETVSPDAGQIILANCTDVRVEEQEISGGSVGILLGFSSNNTLVRNEVRSASWEGITLFESDGNILRANSVGDNEYPGIFLWESDENIIDDNLVFRNEFGIFTFRSINNTIIDNRVLLNDFQGITLSISDGNRLEKNSVSQNNYGIALTQSRSNTLVDNTAEANSLGMIIYFDSTDNIVQKNTASNNGFGIILEISHDNTLRKNTVSSNVREGTIILQSHGNLVEGNSFLENDYSGIYVSESRENKILNNTLSDNTFGIYLDESRENIFRNNYVSEAEYGISLSLSNHNEITFNNVSKNVNAIGLFQSNYSSIERNIITENEYGIYLELSYENKLSNNRISSNEDGPSIIMIWSEDNTISANDLVDNSVGGIVIIQSNKTTLKNNSMEGEGILLGGSRVDNWNTHVIDTSNTVNGDPVYYLKNKTGGTVPQDAGQVILANCTEVSVENQKFTNTIVAIQLGFSDDNILKNNSIRDNFVGIEMWRSNENTLTNNTISDNDDWGAYIQDSYENLIYRNRFIENEVQAYDDGENDWNDEDPEEDGGGGNYWSDYQGQDRGDGIGEEPYEISGDENQDNYPWVESDMAVKYYDLSINIEGDGSTDPIAGDYTYKGGEIVTVEAMPAEDWEFVEWTGDVTGEETTIEITIDRDMEITANFEEEGDLRDRIKDTLRDTIRDTYEYIPGFSSTLLLLAVVIAVAIYYKKDQ